MSLLARRAILVTSLACLSLTCGKSGTDPIRPIEVLYYISGGPDLQFRFQQVPDPSRCGSDGTGLQGGNANHQFGDRVFTTPHFFVMENTFQPVRAVLENLDTVPIQVDIFLGENLQTTSVVNPGECGTVRTDPGIPLIPEVFGVQARAEVCGTFAGVLRPSCEDFVPDPNVAFFATLGDLVSTNVTQCLIAPVATSCTTSTTFFIQNPVDSVTVVTSKFAGQDPTAVMRLELYLDDVFVDSEDGTGDLIVESDV